MTGHFPVDPHEPLSLRSAVDVAGSITPAQIFGWLLYLAGQTQRTTNYLLEELRRMATNDAALTQAVMDLTIAYQANAAAISAEVANLRAAATPETDPAITDAASKIEGIVAQMNQASSAAQAAVAAAQPPASSADESSSTASTAGASTTAPASSAGTAS